MINIEFENKNARRNYPFSDDSDFHDENGELLDASTFSDAILYPESGRCSLVSMEPGTASRSLLITISTTTGNTLTGTLYDNAGSVELFDERGVHRGVLVVGCDTGDLLNNPIKRTFSDLSFCSDCQFELGADGASSIVVGDSVLSGDVSIEPENSDPVVITAVTTDNVDGSTNLRFDIARKEIRSSEATTGIRKVAILRSPTSLINVMERNGSPYLFLTSNGKFNKRAAIGRDDICSSNGATSATKSYFEKTEGQNCGLSDDSGEDTWCRPFTNKNYKEYLKKYDKLAIEIAPDIYTFGYLDIPQRNRYAGYNTMQWMFIEASITASFAVYGYGVVCSVEYKGSEAAKALFFDFKEVENGGGVILLKHTAYKAFFDYIHDRRNGKLGYVTLQKLADIADAQGWKLDPQDNVFPDDVDPVDFNYDMKDRIRRDGLNSYKEMYTIRPRDFFEHFDCKNWEISSSDVFGDEMRYLVGWTDPRSSAYMSGGNSYMDIQVEESTIKVPRWMAARYIWWKRYSKKDGHVRHFIVPKERGLVFYTGNYYVGDDPSGYKERSIISWKCPKPETIGTADPGDAVEFSDVGDGICTHFLPLLPVLKKRLQEEDTSDPTHGDNKFIGYDTDAKQYVEVEIDDDWLASEVDVFENRVTTDTLLAQPDDAPLAVDDTTPQELLCKDMWPGPFEYRYDRLYTPGIGYTDEPSETEKEINAINAPIEFVFDVSNGESSFNLDVTDVVATSFVYDNPLHIEASNNVSSPESLEIEDPTDVISVTEEMKKLTKKRTNGNGITLSIMGLEA